ncbi:D-2-hydroxyacid dehydrogenase [Vagococcus luciliae]|uniref:D-lactate dehydrogenase n=1 Tax=Vagococcus luciliae TaxID=2920380 RepID=A0ABY5P204_9ENTE|nr:D-2-hydroxyacid dehydrogenase [Vagococcus luciliae]UUV99716.1 D-lactate dehydrogenase [Vagococcus luciliae]
MKKIMMMGAREDEKQFADKWAKENNVEVVLTNEVLNEETYHLLKGFDGLSLQQTMGISNDIYAQLSKDGFKQIAQRSAGIDMYNLDVAKENNILITNVPAYSPNSVAEFAVGSVLNCLRHTKLINKRVTNHNFSWDKSILSKEVRELTIGILGTGRIGQLTAEMLKGFGATLIGYDLYKNKSLEAILTYEDNFNTFLASCDVISIHMPLTEENYHLFNEETFAKMKPGSILINASRGAIVNTNDLIKALDSHQLASCALDTYENEMPFVTKDFNNKPINDPVLEELIQRDDVIYTPHIAFYTETAVTNLVSGALDSCLAILNGERPQTIVNL